MFSHKHVNVKKDLPKINNRNVFNVFNTKINV